MKDDPKQSSPATGLTEVRIQIFIPSTGPVVPNTVGIVGKQTFKKIEPTRRLGRSTIYITPCVDHKKPQPTTRVGVKIFDPTNRMITHLGIARACPICWTVLSVVEGDELYSRFEMMNLGEDEMKTFLEVKKSRARAKRKRS